MELGAVLESWAERDGPRYRRLASALADGVEHRRLRGGGRLPAERVLAARLGLSRGTVVAAYDVLAEAEVVQRRRGSGTYVRSRHRGWGAGSPEGAAAVLLRRRLTGGDDVIDLSLSVPSGTDHLPPMDVARWADALDGHGLVPAGLAELRGALARHLSTELGLPAAPDELVVTAGAQEALGLVAAVAGAHGTTLVTGCPTYPGLPGAFAHRGVSVTTVPVDAAGLDVGALGRVLEASGPAIVYVAPTGHNPTGAVMAARRRAELVEVTSRAGALVVEDLALADLVLDGADPPRPLGALARRGPQRGVAVQAALVGSAHRVGAGTRASAQPSRAGEGGPVAGGGGARPAHRHRPVGGDRSCVASSPPGDAAGVPRPTRGGAAGAAALVACLRARRRAVVVGGAAGGRRRRVRRGGGASGGAGGPGLDGVRRR